MTRLSLAEAARETPERVAIVTREGEFTYAAFAARVERASAWLAEQGVAPADERPVALPTKIELPTLELFWALAALGRPLLLLNERASASTRASLLERTRALEIDGASWVRARTTFARRITALEGLSVERDFAIVATSGTTGRPKLAVLSERALLASAAAHYENCGIEPDDRWLLCLSPAHVGGLSILTRSLCARRAVVAFEGSGALRSRVHELGHALEATRATFVSLVPTLVDDLLDAGFEPPKALRATLIGGSGTSLGTLEKAHRSQLPVLPSYGLTEGASQIVARRYTERLRPPDSDSPLQSSGRPLSGVKLRLGSDDRLEFSTPSLLSRYWDEALPVTSDGYFRTSDRANITPDGELIVLGRADDVILTGGEKVDPLAVEGVLLAFPGVRAACVFGEPDPVWGSIVAAAVVAESPLDPAALFRHCAARLASHERPRLLAEVEALIETASGKLNRNETRKSATSRLRLLVSPKPNTDF